VVARRRPRIFDTNIYIAAIRSADPAPVAAACRTRYLAVSRGSFRVARGREVYSGNRSPARPVEASQRRARLLVPSNRDWLAATQVLVRYARQHGALQPRQHMGDVLIALSAARITGEVMTHNVDDFRRWARALRRAGSGVLVNTRTLLALQALSSTRSAGQCGLPPTWPSRGITR
jgi:predicted nucleic acid-binding protein